MDVFEGLREGARASISDASREDRNGLNCDEEEGAELEAVVGLILTMSRRPGGAAWRARGGNEEGRISCRRRKGDDDSIRDSP